MSASPGPREIMIDGPRLAPASGGPARQLIALLHGYGADGSDLIAIGKVWQAAFPDAVFVAPHAPEALPFAGFDGRQWFALEERTPAEYRIGSQAAQPVLDRFLDLELEQAGLDERSLALVGFSQGAMMALQTGLRRKTPPAAILAYSGLLPGVDRLTGIGKQTPVLIVHGTSDDVVPPYHAEAAGDALAQAGVETEIHLLPGLAHGIDGRGLSLGEVFLRSAFEDNTKVR